MIHLMKESHGPFDCPEGPSIPEWTRLAWSHPTTFAGIPIRRYNTPQ